jgi:distribution and morphology protein 31
LHHANRSFSTSIIRRRDPSDKVKDDADEHVHVVDRPRLPFHNYPRSLRELAIRARKEGTTEAKAEYQAAQEEENRSLLRSTKESHEASGAGSRDSSFSASTRWSRPRPPSKEDLLRFAQGFWTRLRIRFKWFTIRGFRRFNADDISAFFTLGGLGTVIFIIVGTTTAVSLVFSALRLLNMQEWIARKIADYLSHETGITVIFESAIVPKWKDSRICFQNVFISKRAYGHDLETLRQERTEIKSGGVSRTKRKRMTAVTAGQGMAWEGTHFDEYDDEAIAPPMSDRARGENLLEEDNKEGEDINNNFSMFDLNVDSIDVKLSFRKWLDGKGLVEDAVVNGVRGIIGKSCLVS